MGTVTAKAQVLLVDYGYDGAIDGVWGRKTQTAFEKAPALVQQNITAMFNEQGKVAPTQHRWVPRPQVDDMIEQAAARYSVQHLVPALKGFVDREAVKQTIEGVTNYDSNSRNGGSKGLMQMQRGAWADVVRSDPSMPGYEKVWDPALNIRAGVRYASMNAKRFPSRIPVNAETLYLAHNQGMGFFLGSKGHPPGTPTNFAGQSSEVKRLIEKYQKLITSAG